LFKFQRILERAKLNLNSYDSIKTVKTVSSISVAANAPVEFDSTSGTIIDTVNSVIYANNHQFFTGEAVVYTTTGTVISPLQATITYYAIKMGDDAFRLASSLDNATNGVFIALLSVGSGVHTFKRDVIFNGSDNLVVDGSIALIKIDNHQFNKTKNDYVLYTRVGGSDIVKLTNNTNYYINVFDENTFSVADENGKELLVEPATSGTQHIFRKIVEFNTTGSSIINTATEVFSIPNHGFDTNDAVQYKIDAGNTAIAPLLDNQVYYVIKINQNSFRLALSPSGTAINITGFGVGDKHSFTKADVVNTRVCTNYRFKIDERFVLNEKCKIAVEAFQYLDLSNPAECKSFGGVYIKNITPSDTYNSQGNYKGTLLLPAFFGDNINYQNNNLEYTSIQLPHNASQLLQNGLDIFIDTKTKDQNDRDIMGAMLEDVFVLSLIIYELDDYDYINLDLNEKIKNYNNTRLV
jgi:hypothetical protein